MTKRMRARQPEFWNSAPTELDRLTHFSRLEERERIAHGWRRNMLYAAGFAFALVLIASLLKILR